MTKPEIEKLIEEMRARAIASKTLDVELAKYVHRLCDALEKCVQQRNRLAMFSPAKPVIVKDEMNQELTKILRGEK